MNDKPFTITFYSYRGGADRLTALVNVGVELARRSHKVLLVDFDLESPGLTALLPLRLEQPHLGLVEFVAEYLDTNQAPPVREYLYRAASIGKKGGELWVMPAGKEDPDYWAALARINWQELYDLHAGFLFFEDTRLQWQQEVKPHYVLINAPGGVNDRTAICTRQLPDLVMLLAAADMTDLAGLQLVCGEFRREREEETPLALVLTGLPDVRDYAGRLRERAQRFAEFLDTGPMDWVYDSLLHRDDWLFADRQPVVSARPHSRAAREYRRLARVCMTANCENDRAGARWFLKRLQKDLRKDPRLAIDAALEEYERRHTTKRLDRILTRFIRDAEIVLMGTTCLFQARRHYMALYTLGLALEEQPDTVEILLRRAEYNAKLKLPLEAVKDLRRILEKGEATPDQIRREAKRLLRALAPEDKAGAFDEDEISAAEGKYKVVEGFIFPNSFNFSPKDPDAEALYLLDGHRWKEVIALLEPRVVNSPDFNPWDAFYLALAYWAATGQLHPDLCKRGIDKFLAQPAESEPTDLWRLQVLSVMFWGAGEREKALSLLEAAKEMAKKVEKSPEKAEELGFPSFWRGMLVSYDQFMEDCQEQRLMIRMGSSPPIRPPYLDDTFEI